MTFKKPADTRIISLKGRKTRRAVDYETIHSLTVLMAACMVESSAFYIYPTKNGESFKIKVYDSVGPVECWVNTQEDLSEQIEEFINEMWGEQTWAEAQALMVLGGVQQAPDAPAERKPTRNTDRGSRKSQNRSGEPTD